MMYLLHAIRREGEMDERATQRADFEREIYRRNPPGDARVLASPADLLTDEMRAYLSAVAPNILLADVIRELHYRWQLSGPDAGRVLGQWISERYGETNTQKGA